MKNAGRPPKYFTVILSCMHEKEFQISDSIDVGTELVCYQCRGPVIVLFVRKWSAECTECTYRNTEGNATACARKARIHCERRRHRVKLHYPSFDESVSLVPSCDRMVDWSASA